MRVVVFAARKGGSGKTTLAAHLAVEAERVGDGPVILIDTDPQRSLSDWWKERKADTPRLLEAALPALRKELSQTAHLEGYVMIDTPPLDAGAISSVVEVADLVVIPVKPSPHDLRGVAVTVDLVKRLGKPFVFVVNQAIPRASLTQQAPMVLSQFGRVALEIVHARVDYAGSMTDGRTVQEIEAGGKAANEVRELWKYVKTQLRNSVEDDLRQATGEAAHAQAAHR